jgi:hypothetical protein
MNMTMNLFEFAPATAVSSSPTIYRIPEHKFESFKASIERLKRRAAKLGCGEIGYITHGIEVDKGYSIRGRGGYDRFVFLPDGQNPFTVFGVSYTPASCSQRKHLVSVTGDPPKLNGWQFMAALDPMSDEDGNLLGNLVRSIPGAEIPEQFRTTGIVCDHCQVRRSRNSTYLVRHDDGIYKQVGRQCLKDFLGHSSPESVAGFAEVLFELRALLEEDVFDDEMDQEESGAARRTYFYKLIKVLEMATCLVRMNGWKPSYHDMQSTKEQLIHWTLSSGAELARIEKDYQITDADRENARLAVEWMATLESSRSDYEFNLYLLSRVGRVRVDSFGFLASAVPAFMRHRADTEDNGSSEYVGEIGKRSEMTLTLVSTSPFESAFGTQTICKFTDDQGNAIVWWASTAPNVAVGARIKGKATVKKHEVREGVKQTTILRLAVIEVMAEAQVQAA